MTVGELIKRARKQNNLSQKELAEKLGVSASMIGQYENDLRNPKIDTLRRIAEALNVPINTFTEDVDVIRIPMPDYPTKIPSQEEVARMTSVEREYYSLRLLADASPDKLERMLYERYNKMNKLGKVEAVIRLGELAELPKYTEADPNNVPLTFKLVKADPSKKTPQD